MLNLKLKTSLFILLLMTTLCCQGQKKTIIEKLPSLKITVVVDTINNQLFTRSITVNRMPITQSEFSDFFDEVLHNYHCGNALKTFEYQMWIADKAKTCASVNTGDFSLPSKCILNFVSLYNR